MLNSPITGDEYLDTFLYDLRDAVVNINSSAGTETASVFVSPAAGSAAGYPYRYMHIKYADDNVGGGISNVQTNKKYFGIFNSDLTTESTNPTDYTWIEVSGSGFGTTYFLWYIVTPGRQFGYYVSLSSPGVLYSIDTTTAIDLNLTSAIADQSARMAYTLVFDLLSASPSFYTTPGSLSVPPINTWSGGETWSSVIPLLSPGSTMYQSDGIYNSTTGLTTWGIPYLAKLKVGSLTANNLIVGSSPAISGKTMTGSGALIKTNGTFALGDSSRNIVNNGAGLYINGFIKYTSGNTNISSGSGTFPAASTTTTGVLATITTTRGIFQLSSSGFVSFYNTGSISRSMTINVFIKVFDVTAGDYVRNNAGYPLDIGFMYASTPTAGTVNNRPIELSVSSISDSYALVNAAFTGITVENLAGHTLRFDCIVNTYCYDILSTPISSTLVAEIREAPTAYLGYSIMDTNI